VLDGPETAPSDNEPELELPAVDEAGPVRTRTVDLERGTTAPPQAPAEPESATPEQAVALIEPSPQSSPATAETDRVEPSESGAGAPEESRAPASDASQTSAASQASADSETSAASDEPEVRSAATASAPVNDAASRSAAAKRSGTDAAGWMVQLGSFGEQANAERLVQRVSTYGYSARVMDHVAGGRTLHRVRIGGYASRNEAESAIASLAAHGFVAQVVAPE
jgi:DedD protein